MAMTRVLVNMPCQFSGRQSGVARVAFALLERLLENPSFAYVLRSPWTVGDLPSALRHPRLVVETVPRPRIMVVDVLRQLIVVPQACLRHKIDLVLNVEPYGAARGGRARIMVVHDLYFRTIPEQTGPREAITTNFIFRLMLRGHRDIVVVSEATRRELERWYPQARGLTQVIHSASTLRGDIVSDVQPTEVAGRYVLAVGNATHNKNFGVLAAAVASLHRDHPDLRIVHVGQDAGETIQAALAIAGEAVPLTRLSGIDDARLAALYGGALCLCVPSLSEGFCLPVLEAQEFGCPVICANRSATPEIAGEGALTFDPTDTGALAEALRRLLTDSILRDDLIRRGRANAALFSWDAAARAYEAVMSRALASAVHGA